MVLKEKGVKKMDLKTVSKWIVVIGAVLYGLSGVFGLNLVGSLLGGVSFLAKLVYLAVLACGLWAVYNKLTKPSKKR